MPTFAYSGRTRAGETVTGERIADTMDAVVAALRREQVLVTQINPIKEKAGQGAESCRGRKGVDPKNLAVFIRQFSVMIDAGLPLVQCLEILGTQEEDKNFAGVILATRGDVESGASLADAMKKHPKVFDPLFTNMIAAGEAGGILDTILKRLATYIEKAVKLQGPGQVGDDLPGRRHRDRRRRRRRHSVEGHSDVREPVRRPRRRAAAADARRHRAQQQPGALRAVPHRRHWWAPLRLQVVLRDAEGPEGHRRHRAEAADPRPADAEDRGGAVLPHAVDAARLGRVDSRSARHHRENGGQRGRRGRHPDDAQEHRARRDDRRAAARRRRCFRRWSCR